MNVWLVTDGVGIHGVYLTELEASGVCSELNSRHFYGCYKVRKAWLDLR